MFFSAQKPPIGSFGAWVGRRSGIKEEPEGRGTAAEPSKPSAEAVVHAAPNGFEGFDKLSPNGIVSA